LGIIKNPNDIVEQYVADYQAALGDNLVSVVMYGSAVTHEYKPGVSDINTILVVKKNNIPEIQKCKAISQRWHKQKISLPFFMTQDYIAQSLDSYPVEFIDIKSMYKVLFGEDVFANLDIKKNDIRLQCERELKGVALHLRREYMHIPDRSKDMYQLLTVSFKKIIPLFKAILVLEDKCIPNLRSDIIMAIEDTFNLNISVFTNVNAMILTQAHKTATAALFAEYVSTIDLLISHIDTYNS